MSNERLSRSPPLRTRCLRLCCIALSVAALTGCRHTLLVALPSNDAEWKSDFAARATEHEVAIEARLRAWRGEPRDLDERATPVFVRIANEGSVPIQISPRSFELVSGTARFRPIAAAQIADAGPRVVAVELPTSMLAPGASSSGFVYFPRIVGDWGFVHLRTTLVDDSRRLLGSVDVPFVTGHYESCSLGHVDEREAALTSDLLFRTCLVPF